MKTLNYICLLVIGFAFIMGCSGNNAHLRNLSDSESKAAQQEIIDNWSDYNIKYNNLVIVFDRKNDDKKIIVNNYWWSTVEDQKTWNQMVNGTMTQNMYAINMLWGEPIREIWVHNQFYGYIITPLENHYYTDSVSVTMVDDNAAKLFIY